MHPTISHRGELCYVLCIPYLQHSNIPDNTCSKAMVIWSDLFCDDAFAIALCMYVVGPLPYCIRCSVQNLSQALGFILMKSTGKEGKECSTSGMPSFLASGQHTPILLPPSEQLDSEATHSHQPVTLRLASRRCKAKIKVPASSAREQLLTMLQSTPMLSM